MNTKVNQALQYLLGETKFESENGYFLLEIQDEGEEIQVTVDFHETERDFRGTNVKRLNVYLMKHILPILTAKIHSQLNSCLLIFTDKNFHRSMNGL